MFAAVAVSVKHCSRQEQEGSERKIYCALLVLAGRVGPHRKHCRQAGGARSVFVLLVPQANSQANENVLASSKHTLTHTQAHTDCARKGSQPSAAAVAMAVRCLRRVFLLLASQGGDDEHSEVHLRRRVL